jgi:hypothetical protein
MNASRQKVENDFRRDSLESIRAELKEMAIASSADLDRIFTLSDPLIKEDIKSFSENRQRGCSRWNIPRTSLQNDYTMQ